MGQELKQETHGASALGVVELEKTQMMVAESIEGAGINPPEDLETVRRQGLTCKPIVSLTASPIPGDGQPVHGGVGFECRPGGVGANVRATTNGEQVQVFAEAVIPIADGRLLISGGPTVIYNQDKDGKFSPGVTGAIGVPINDQVRLEGRATMTLQKEGAGGNGSDISGQIGIVVKP